MKKAELQNQISLYSLETKDFYNKKEIYYSDPLLFYQLELKKIKDNKEKLEKYLNTLNQGKDILALAKKGVRMEHKIHSYEKYLKKIEIRETLYKKERDRLKKKLQEEINKDNDGKPRKLSSSSLRPHKVVALFESTLTRTCGIKSGKLTDKLFIIRAYHYKILESIIKNGFYYGKEHYQYFTSSAGQIRTKKIVCINSALFERHENSIVCGLTQDKINNSGGVNTNKYQAYLALINSASAKWRGFNIDKTIVVDDMNTIVKAKVDHINHNTFEIDYGVDMDLGIEHMDGCGIMLPSVSDKSFMYRMPWVKGLLSPFDFKEFAKIKGQSKIKDIYGKEYDVLEDDIQIIMTKSQFKMAKYYKSWEDYKEQFKKYKCEASQLNIEDIGSEANINYQMLQTLVSMTEEEITKLAQPTIDIINDIGTNKNTMLKLLGATKENKSKNSLQEALILYPELLNDKHTREIVKNNRLKFIKDAKAGKLKVNGYYTFLIPDLYAFCEWLFLGDEAPSGLLENQEVYCNIFKEGKVDVLRAPHLYKEHAIRNNTLKEEISKWFITKGIYTSVHDPISRILQFDNDGDRALVIQDSNLIEVAEREMEGILPLYYEMAKAEDQPINPDNIYLSLTSAYKANIGIISNDITKIWNSEKPNVDAVRWLTAMNNYVIDYAKTLYKPEIPKHVDEIIKSFTKNKLPHFFKHAKDKQYYKPIEGQIKNPRSQVEELNTSTVNNLESIIPDGYINYNGIVANIDYKMLMKRKKTPHNQEVIDAYERISRRKRFIMSSLEDKRNAEQYFDTLMVEELKSTGKKLDLITDILIEYLYEEGDKSKTNLWNALGYIIVENLKNNLEGTKSCEKCLERFDTKNGKDLFCEPCKHENQLESKRKWKNGR